MDSTVYRRGPDGKHIGIPEALAREQNSQTPPAPREVELPQQSVPVIIAAEPELPNEVPVTDQSTYQPPLAYAPVDESHFEYGDEPEATREPAVSEPVFSQSRATTYTPERSREPRPVRPPREPKAPKTKKQRNIFMRIFRALRWVVAAYIIFYIAFAFWASSLLQKVPATTSHQVPPTAGQNWLMVGSDSRTGLTRHERAILHTGKSLGSNRTDTIMIVHFDGSGAPTIVALPRDSYVNIPKHKASDGSISTMKHNKINAAYAIGGAPFLVKTVELNTGLHIDHYMEVGFAGIVDITDAVGGIHVCIPKNYDDKYSGLHVKKGCQSLDGKTALAYVRMRYADPTGDIGRIGRQQQFIAAVLHKSVTPGVLLNPLAMVHLAKAGTSALTVGESDSLVDIAHLGKAMRALTQGKGKVMTVPVSDTNATTAAGSSVLWNKAKAHKLFQQLGAK